MKNYSVFKIETPNGPSMFLSDKSLHEEQEQTPGRIVEIVRGGLKYEQALNML